jgi:hypothetical protein
VIDSWDKQHHAPVRTWSSLEDLHVDGRQRHVVKPGQGEAYALDCLVDPKDSRTLVVALYGALNREATI